MCLHCIIYRSYLSIIGSGVEEKEEERAGDRREQPGVLDLPCTSKSAIHINTHEHDFSRYDMKSDLSHIIFCHGPSRGHKN